MGWTCSNGTDASILHKFGQFIHVGQQIILPINARLCAHIVETRKSTDDTFGNEVSLSLLHLLYSLNNNDFEHITVFESLQRNTAPRWHFSVLEKKNIEVLLMPKFHRIHWTPYLWCKNCIGERKKLTNPTSSFPKHVMDTDRNNAWNLTNARHVLEITYYYIFGCCKETSMYLLRPCEMRIQY